ncbi:MAG: acyl carrier protein [Clostridia bacterium]|nr:acyl carrier protein [Clostridia bacterium]
MQTFEKICVLLREQLGLDGDFTITEKTTIQDLDADSLDVAEFFMTLEDTYDIEIPEESELKVHTVGDVAELVESLL